MTIRIRTIGEIEDYLLEALKSELEKTFKRSVEIGPPMPWPSYAFNPDRKQYHSTSILRRLAQGLDLGDPDQRVLGVAEVDLYLPSLTFVFGEADPIGKAALVSNARLKQGYLRQPARREIMIERLVKEATHELGHTYGLLHCLSRSCVMLFSSTLREADRKPASFCSSCQKILNGR